jgi:putative endonuclease
MHYLYILQSECDKSFYIGVTNDTQRRLNEHNAGLSRSTKSRTPWMIVHREEFESITEAYRRERYIKSRKKRKYIESIINVRARSSAG